MYQEVSGENKLLEKILKIFSCCFGFIAIILYLVTSSLYLDIGSALANTSGVIGVIDYLSYDIYAAPMKNITIRQNGCDIGEDEMILYQWRVSRGRDRTGDRWEIFVKSKAVGG